MREEPKVPVSDEWRKRLHEIVQDSGRTQSDIASEAGLNPSYLTQILWSKGCYPRIDNLQRIARVLNTSVAFLVEGVTAEKSNPNG